jgi:hypothetical protein
MDTSTCTPIGFYKLARHYVLATRVFLTRWRPVLNHHYFDLRLRPEVSDAFSPPRHR